MMSNHHQVIDELAGPTRALREAAPDAWAGFGALHKAAVADGGQGADGVGHRGCQAVRRVHRQPITPRPPPGEARPPRRSPRRSASHC